MNAPSRPKPDRRGTPWVAYALTFMIGICASLLNAAADRLASLNDTMIRVETVVAGYSKTVDSLGSDFKSLKENAITRAEFQNIQNRVRDIEIDLAKKGALR